MKTIAFLVVVLFLVTACTENRVNLDEVAEGEYVSCDQVRDPICSITSDTVCAKIKLVGQLTDNIEWKEYFNGCKACQASTKDRVVMGFEKGKCGLSSAERNPGMLVIPGKAEPTKVCAVPSDDFVSECEARGGQLQPLETDGNCTVSYHCIVSG
jgi:hypothetical protein